MENEKDSREQYADWKTPEADLTQTHEREPSDETPEEAFKRYQGQLGLDESSLVGKQILDVGSNDSLFEKYLEQKYPGTKVVSIDMDHAPGISAQMKAESLGFKEESFDAIVAHGVPWDAEGLKQSITEFVRVMRLNGETRIGPMWANGSEYGKAKWEQVHQHLADLKSQGLIDTEDVQVGETEFKEGTEPKFCIVIKKLNKV